MSASEEECPVCQDKIRNPSPPSACCGKVLCQTCLNQSIRFRAHCPYCRTPINSHELRANRRRNWHQIPGRHSDFSAGRPVGGNIQSLLSQLQAANAARSGAQASLPNQAVAQTSLPSQAAPPPAAQNQGPPIFNPFIHNLQRPVPMPRNQTQPVPSNVNPAPGLVQSTPAPTPILAPILAPLPQQYPVEDLEAELDEWPWQTEIRTMELNQQQQPQGSTVATFVCPYCQEDGLDELDLLDHCNDYHANDRTRVVCPVCVSMPHGDPQLYSRNFIGHLNMRHCFYQDDFTNVRQTDEMNIQHALLASYAKNN